MDPLDTELNAIINKLNKVQGQVGGAKAKVSVIGEDGKLDRFLDLKGRMLDRLHDLKETLQLKETLDKAGGNPKDLIAAGSKIRTDLAALNDEWKELDHIYRAEAKKKRSKHTPEEMATRQQILMKLQMEITNIKEAQRAGYVKGYQAIQISSMEDSELFKPNHAGNASKIKDFSDDGEERSNASSVVTGSRNNNMTDEHRLQLHAIKERDTQIDQEIVKIGLGVDELHKLALTANEEVKLQNKMLDVLEKKIDNVHEHVTGINEKLKATLDEARKSDKICMDIICVIILIGMIIVLVKISKDNQNKR